MNVLKMASIDCNEAEEVESKEERLSRCACPGTGLIRKNALRLSKVKKTFHVAASFLCLGHECQGVFANQMVDN